MEMKPDREETGATFTYMISSTNCCKRQAASSSIEEVAMATEKDTRVDRIH